MGRITHRKAVVFLVSDFLAEGYERPLGIVARRHDVIAISITDPRERELPKVGLIELEDAETGEIVGVDSSSFLVRRQYEAIARERAERLAESFRSSGVDHIPVLTGRDYVRDLVRFFRGRERRL